MSKHVVILGGGPAGLSAGWALSRDGADIDVLEMDSQVGGLCKSVMKNGFIFDLGGHRFITKDDLLLGEIKELMGEELTTRTRRSEIWLRGKFFTYPLEIKNILKGMNPVISFRCGLDFLLTKFGLYSKLGDVSFENWILKRFGRTMYEIYFGPYSHKLWGVPPDQISSAWAAQRISLINITDVLLRMLGKKKDTPKTYASNFLYPRKGIGQISERMSEEIEKKGGRVHLNARVEKVVVKNDRIEKIVYTQGGIEKSISGDFVISTIPLPEFILSVEPKLEEKYPHTAREMRFRCIRFLHITLSVEQVSQNTWIYVPEEKYPFFRIQDRRNWCPTVVPEKKNALTLEIACNKNDAMWNAPEEEVFDRCMKGLEELKIINRGMVTDYFTQNVDHAYPVYTLDYQQKIKIAYRALSGLKDFIAIGRQGLFRYNNMDHSLKMGLLAAKHILHNYSKKMILEIATEDIIFDWQDPGYHDSNIPEKKAPSRS